MKILPSEASDADILAAVREWVAALASGDFAAAYSMTDHDPYYGWSPDLIRDVIAGYGLPEPTADGIVHRVTPLETATGGPTPRHSVDRSESPRPLDNGRLAIGEVWFDLPLDGEWGDLTATFEVQLDAAGIRVVLHEIHVF